MQQREKKVTVKRQEDKQPIPICDEQKRFARSFVPGLNKCPVTLTNRGRHESQTNQRVRQNYGNRMRYMETSLTACFSDFRQLWAFLVCSYMLRLPFGKPFRRKSHYRARHLEQWNVLSELWLSCTKNFHSNTKEKHE